ncbi:hypothetical protein, partial [Listeria booriae]|uniref:hypothetical protein n=1 Tax=Listeria booriae TaxID=1552123 RepID=UPI001C9D14F0
VPLSSLIQPNCTHKINKPRNIPDPASAGSKGAKIAETEEKILLMMLSEESVFFSSKLESLVPFTKFSNSS